jgi:hypothetical protein
MSTDYAGKEREFLATLAADTGRDLGAWMAEISAKGLADKNDIIDWLRREGFPFWKASWLERIHHNGGQPLYCDHPNLDDAGPGAPAVARGEFRGTPPPISAAPSQSSIEPPAPCAPSATVPPSAPSSLDELLARAKAYRPLAAFLMSAIGKAVPEAQFAARSSHISVAAPAEFAAIGIGARELRLGLALGAATPSPALERLRPASAAARLPSGMTHFAVLTDARQVDADLLALVAAANAAVNAIP